MITDKFSDKHGGPRLAKQSDTQARASSRRPALTLVELLVVMAIISALTSILVPALGRARDEAKLIICRSRLRNVCVSALLYAGDHRGALPIDTMLGPDYEDVSNPHGPLFAALEGYLESPENYYCPSETDPALKYTQENFAAGVMGYYYFSCDRASGNRDISTFLRWDVQWPRHLRDTWHPKTWVVSDSWFRDRPTPHRWFQKGVNYATIESSVEMVSSSPRQSFR